MCVCVYFYLNLFVSPIGCAFLICLNLVGLTASLPDFSLSAYVRLHVRLSACHIQSVEASSLSLSSFVSVIVCLLSVFCLLVCLSFVVSDFPPPCSGVSLQSVFVPSHMSVCVSVRLSTAWTNPSAAPHRCILAAVIGYYGIRQLPSSVPVAIPVSVYCPVIALQI